MPCLNDMPFRWQPFAVATIHRWKHREKLQDVSSRPHRITYKLTPEEARMILEMRRKGLSLDDLFEALEPVLPHLLPHLRRATLHRLLQRHGLGRLKPCVKKQHGQFKDYLPGFLHMDCFKLPTLENSSSSSSSSSSKKRYCFVAIDRATRLMFLWVYEHKDKTAATDFLQRCLEFYPFRIEKILTDNGREFTLAGFRNRWGSMLKPTTVHPFEKLCQQNTIEHRRTRPYTPKTNGLVERANRLIKDNTTKRHRYADVQQMIEALKQWNIIYNFHRSHRRIGRKTPYQSVCHWYQKHPTLFQKEPQHLLKYRLQPCET